MPRGARWECAGEYVHVMNRRVDRQRLFAASSEYEGFASLLAWAQREIGMEITAWTLMPNHWHLIVRPRSVQHLSQFMHRVESVHAMAVRRDSVTRGSGCVYGSRFKGFVIPHERVLRGVVYVERNPVKAGLVGEAFLWTHGSAASIGDGIRTPRVTRLPWELERHRARLLREPLPEEFEADFRNACRGGFMSSSARMQRVVESAAGVVRKLDAARNRVRHGRGSWMGPFRGGMPVRGSDT
ncbi:MAG: transposase [Phycisphaerales bacterium]|jgi:REP element-mobilizing transposase RayT